MTKYATEVQERTGAQSVEHHHVVCHDCRFEQITIDSWAAETLVAKHRDEFGHDVESARIE